jgi:RNA polymerase sigma factor (sigma-70 family)
VSRDALPRSTAAELVRQVAQGDRSAFEQLFNVYAPRVKTLMIQAGASSDTAEELTRTTMLAVWRNARHYDSQAVSVATWIYRLARDTRMHNHHPASDVPGPAPVAPHAAPTGPNPTGPNPSPAPWNADCDEHIAAEIDRLPAEQALILREVIVNSRRCSDVGQQHGVPLDTVKSSVAGALATLRAAVARWCR